MTAFAYLDLVLQREMAICARVRLGMYVGAQGRWHFAMLEVSPGTGVSIRDRTVYLQQQQRGAVGFKVEIAGASGAVYKNSW